VVGWDALADELDAWAAAGRQANLWWRDDDATELTDALARLIDLAGVTQVPLCLAVIPAAATPGLAACIAGAADGAAVVVHGYAHRDHAPPGQPKAEFHPERGLDAMTEEVERAWRRTLELFGPRAMPVLVPPWNRIARDLIPRLPAAGYRGLSTIASARPGAVPVPVAGLRRRNAHIDIIDWRGSRAFIGDAAALKAIVARLAAFRDAAGTAPPPLGILTHHLMHDAAAWAFLDKFIARTRGHRSVRWPTVAKIFTF
jgi:hypothetical protein